MANKMTPISQDVVINLKARTSEIENSIKSLIQKLQGTNLSDSFTKGYISSLQKVLDKSQELKKTISDTSSVNSKTTADWTNSYNKLAAELTKTIAKLEGHSVKFSDLVSFDSSEYKQLKKALDSLRVARKNIYSKKNIEKNMPKIAEGVITQKTIGSVQSNIDDQKEITRILNEQLVSLNRKSIAEQDSLDILNQKLVAYKAILAVNNNLANLDARKTASKAALEYARQQTGMPKTATKQDIATAWTAGNFSVTQKDIDKINRSIPDVTAKVTDLNSKVAQLATYKQDVLDFAQRLSTDFQATAQPLATAENALEKFRQAEINAANVDLDKISTDANQIKTAMQDAGKATEDYTDSLVQLEARQTFFSDMQSKITQIFGLANAFQALRRFIQESWTAIKELDAAFTEIAVVTDFTTGDLWESFDTYNKMAQQLGVTTTDAIETSALYYQQGLDTAEVMTLTTETIKMARIANMDFATATQAMTSAIRGFKLEMSDAQTITDTYSALAAEAAVDTDQLATAISKTASIAGNAGLTLEDTSAFLTQIIETTQEAPETAGTALKTIIARFTELKKNPAALKVEVEGEEVSANKIEEALRTANVALRDTEGNFRDLDEVFLELSSKWNSLDRNTQRYIATVAAGSRQQSRFIAMMDDYERTTELIGIAYDSAGAGAIQFAKTLDSVSARVNKLKSNFEALIGNLVENETVKAILDALNEGMTILVNASEKGIVAFGALIFMVGKAVKTALTLVVSQFANAEKKNEELRAKIGKTIKTTVIYQPDLTLVNEANKQLKIDPITVGTAAGRAEKSSDIQTYTKFQRKRLDLQEQYAKSYDNVIKKQKIYQNMLKSEAQYTLNDASGMSQAYIQNAKKAVDSAIKESRTAAWKLLTPTIATTVSSGVVQGIATGVISEDWKVGLATGIISTVSSALSNPAITKTIGNMFTKSGGTIATALAGIGSKVAAAVPYVAIAAGVAAIGYGLYNWFDPIQRANRELKNAQDNLDKVNSSLEKTRANYLSEVSKAKSISDDIKTYKKLSSQVRLTTDEQEKLNQTVTKLAEQFPQIITGYTEAGQVIIDQKTNWQEILELQKQSIALSQAQYASDVLASVDATEETRSAELNAAKAKKEDIANDLRDKAATDLTNEGKLQPSNYEEGLTNRQIEDLILERTKEYMAASVEYQAALGEENKLLRQGELYAQEKANAYSQIANSMITSYNAIQTLEKDKVTTDEISLIQSGIADLIENNKELQTLSKDTSEEGKQKYIAAAQAAANAYIAAFQSQLDSSTLDVSQLTTALGSMTVEDFKKYLAEHGITQGELYDLLVGKAEAQQNGVEQLLGKSKINFAVLKNIFDNQDLFNIFNTMGAEDGAAYVDGLYNALQQLDPTKQKEVAKYLSGLDLSSVDVAKQATAILQSKYGLTAEQAVDIVIRFVDQEGNPIGTQTLLGGSGIREYFAQGGDITSADTALEEFNTTGDISAATVETLITDFPELSGVLRKFANDTNVTTDDINKLKKALIDASNNKKSIDYFKRIGEQVNILKDNLSNIDSYEYFSAMESLKDSLDITGLENANEIILNNLSDIEAAANGNVEAWNRVQTAIKEARLATIGFSTLTAEQQESATNLLNQFTGKLDELSNGDYSAEFSINGVDYTDPLFEGIIDKLANIFGNTDAAIAYLETMGGITIEPVIEKVAVPMPTTNGGDDRAVYQKNNGTTYLPKYTYKVRKKNNYNPGYVRRKPSSTSGNTGSSSSGNDYETKVDKYYNEINAIKKLNTELDKLAELREKGNLSPEEYRNNINLTAKYYRELQDKYHDYSEKLRADRAKLETEVANLKLPNAISMKDGVLTTNKEAIDAIASADTREKIDDIITKVDELNDALKENSDGWWKAKYALEELADSYMESFTSVEDKIREILIKHDQDEIDETEKKYDKIKQADEDYLKALKDNISKRRKARKKETDYNDLAKKEKRLALLKRDTSGVYAAEILSLEEEIAQARQDLSDKEIDDMVDSLEEQATKRADAYDKELEELKQLQKDKEKSMVEYNKEVDKIMQAGEENILKWLQTYDEEYLTASETARKKYLEGWKNTIAEANGYINNVANGTVMTRQDAAATKAQDYYSELAARGYSKGAADIQSHDAAGALKWYNDFIANRDDLAPDIKKLFWNIVVAKHQWAGTTRPEIIMNRQDAATKAQDYYSELAARGYSKGAADIQSHDAAGALKWYNDFIANRDDLAPDIKKLFWNIVVAKHQWAGTPVPGYSEGGVVDTTGLVMVHGTPTKPEAFLSAADTKNFQILMELLNKAVNYRGDTQSDVPNALQIGECQIIVEVGSIADDYDVDRAIDKVKQSIVDNSNYRNVNIVTRKK